MSLKKLSRKSVHTAPLLIGALLPLSTLAQAPAPEPVLQLAALTPRTALIEEVLVSARRREENLQQVPIAVSALTGDQLEREGAFSAGQLTQKIPSTVITGFNPRNASISIRGLGLASSNDGLENSVGTFIDGVYLARPASTFFDLIDIERIEVLRGPQGTLFGKNTTAGALNISTRKPAFEPELNAELSIGNYGFQQYKLAANAPVTESLATRLALFSTERDGFVDHVGNGRDYNDHRNVGARGQLLWQPNDDLSARLIIDYAKQKQNCCVQAIFDYGVTAPDGSTRPNNFFDRAARIGYTPLPIDPFGRRTDIDSPQFFKMEQGGISLELNWSLENHTVTSLTAARQWKWDASNDADWTAARVFLSSGVPSEQKQLSQELRITSENEGALEYVAGLFLFHQEVDSSQVGSYGPDAAAWLLGSDALRAVLDGYTSIQHVQPTTDSYALFAQADWEINARWSLTVGARYTYEEKSGRFHQYGYGGAELAPGLQAIRNNFGALEKRFKENLYEGALSGLVSLNFQLSDDVLVYASAARGYKSGGINLVNLPTAVDPLVDAEEATDFSMGVKSEWFDRRLLVNGAIYRTEIDDYQAVQADPIQLITYLSNAARVSSEGAELEIVAVPVEGLRLGSVLGYSEGRYDEYENAPCPIELNSQPACDLSGKPLLGAPRVTASASVDYSFPLGRGAEGYVGLNYAYTDDYRTTTSSLPAFGIDSYAVANAYLGARLLDGQVDLSLWGRNLFDEEYATNKSPTLNTAQAVGNLGDPRTWGVTLRLRY